MINSGDRYAENVYRAMAYQISKDICAMSACLSGMVDAVILTGGLAFSKMLTGWIIKRVSFLGRVVVYPGEDEMSSLAQGGLRALDRAEEIQKY
jgi:butyrate kinase